MRALIAGMIASAAVTPFAATDTDTSLTPGLYQVEVRISLPNVQDVAAPIVLSHCVSKKDLESGRAFFVLSDNPLKECDLADYRAGGDSASYQIICPGPNRGSALAMFQTTSTAYHGNIKMNMGGKNMTMSETQVGKRIGDCQ